MSRSTMQQALDRLATDGFVQSFGRLGTFVSPHPPHLSQYALVFYGVPGYRHVWSPFWQNLSNAAVAVERTSQRKLPQFFEIQGHSDVEDYQRLLRAIRGQRLAGLIFTSAPIHIPGDPVIEEPGIPRVGITYPDSQTSIAGVTLDTSDFFDRAVGHLVARGRRRIAVVCKSEYGSHHQMTDHLLVSVQKHGAIHHTFWRQYLDNLDCESVINAVQLLMRLGPTDRPDGLIVSDDTMLDLVIVGLVAASVRVPQDIEVIAHANFPCTGVPTLPIKRLGYDSAAVLDACIDSIDRQRRGEEVPPVTVVPAVFEDEVKR